MKVVHSSVGREEVERIVQRRATGGYYGVGGRGGGARPWWY